MKKKKFAALSLAVVMTATAPISAFAEVDKASNNANEESVLTELNLDEARVEKEPESKLMIAPVKEPQAVKTPDSELTIAPVEKPHVVKASAQNYWKSFNLKTTGINSDGKLELGNAITITGGFWLDSNGVRTEVPFSEITDIIIKKMGSNGTFTVDSNGKFTPTEAGKYNISAKHNGQFSNGYPFTVVDPNAPDPNVDPNSKATGARIGLGDNSSYEFRVGGASTIKVSFTPEDYAGAVKWKVEPSNVLEISPMYGTRNLFAVDGKAEGRAKVTAIVYGENGEIESNWIQFKVNPADGTVRPITIDPNSKATFITVGLKDSKQSNTVKIGHGTTLLADIHPYDYAGKVEWKSSDPSVATVNSFSTDNRQVLVRGVKDGNVTITATVTGEDGKDKVSNEYFIYVGKGGNTSEVKPTAIKLNPNSITLAPNGSQKITAAVEPSNATNNNITWTSSDANVATVDQNGKVTAHKAGTATITATSQGDNTKKATATVTVSANTTEVKPTGITLNPNNITLNPNETKNINATLTPGNATNKNITWTSSDANVATVDQNGKVTAHKAGTATITAKSQGNESVKATATVTVNAQASTEVDASSVIVGLKNSSYSNTFKVNESTKLKADVNPNNYTGTVTWNVADPTIAKVTADSGNDKEAVVTGLKVGTTTVTATVKGENGNITSGVFYIYVKNSDGTSPIYPNAKKITNVKVYYDKISGYAEPYSTVRLYKDGISTGYSAKADSTGYFSISYSFGSRNYRYWNDNYRYWDWDEYYDYYGYYWKDYPYYYRYYDGYYYNYDYDLSRFSLKSFVGTTEVSKYNVLNSDGYNYWYDGYYYPGYYNRYYYDYDRYYDYKVYPTSLDLNIAKDTVSGYLTSYPNRYVAVYRNGSFLGSAYINSNGYFKIDLNTYVGTTSNLDFYVDRYKTSTTETSSTTNNTYRTKITIGSRTLQRSINGASRTITMDVEAYIKEGRTMLPVRYVAESLGYDVTYIDRNRSAVITDGKDVITIYLDSAKYTVNGVEKTFEVKPEIRNDRTMLPIAEIARALGLSHGTKGSGKNIEWDNSTRTVVIERTK